MKFQLLALTAALALSACGGGGGGSSPVPTPTASVTPQNNSIQVAWSGAEHSISGKQISSLHLLDLSPSEPIAIGATEVSCGTGCTTLGDNGLNFATNTANIVVKETTALGVPVVAAAPVITVSVALASTSGPPNTTATQTSVPIKASTAPGIGTLTVAVDGFTQTINIQILPNLAIESSTGVNQYHDAVFGYRFDVNGNAVPVTTAANADIYASLAANGNPSAMVMPYGFQNQSGPTGISSVTAAPVAFVSQGTSLSFAQYNNVSVPASFIVFKTALGKYVYFAITHGSGQGNAPDYASDVAFYGSFKIF